MWKRLLVWLKWILYDIYDAECTKVEFIKWAEHMTINNVNVGDVIEIKLDDDVRFRIKIR